MAGSHQDEIERKYDVGEATVFPNLAEVTGVSAVGQPDELRLEAVYVDTPGFDLARQGVTLRRRSGGTDPGWHLKLARVGDARTELHEPLGGGVETVPESLRARVRALIRERPLEPVAEVRTERREYALRDGDGAVLARVCDDHVRARALKGPQDVQTWREWEVELAGGEQDLLDVVQEHLVGAGAAPSASASKLRRTLGDLVPEERPQPSREELAEGTAGELFVARVVEHTARLHAEDAAVRSGETEGVHQMRIAARRLRSALTTCRPILDREVTDPVGEELRWLGQSLGPARDAQVLRDHLKELLAGQAPELVIGSVAARIDDELGAAHQAARDQAVQALESSRYLSLLDALDDLVASPPLASRGERPAKKEMRRLLRRDAERLGRAERAIESAPDPAQRDLAFHEARKKAKRLRYAAELAEPALGKRARSLARKVKGIQDILGAHQDTVVARERLREYAIRAHLAGDNTFTFGRLHALEEARAERAETDFTKAWGAFRRKQLPQWD